MPLVKTLRTRAERAGKITQGGVFTRENMRRDRVKTTTGKVAALGATADKFSHFNGRGESSRP